MLRTLSFILFFLLAATAAYAQKWLPGSINDVKGNRETGFINPYPSGKGPNKHEAFIEFKTDEKMNPIKLSAGELRSFIAGKDSFVVAHPPGNGSWNGKELDFVKVVINEEIKLYQGKGAGGGGGFKIRPGFSGGVGLGSGGYGGVGGGLGVSMGGNGNRNGEKANVGYFFGANTAEMMEVSAVNFNDIMLDIMGDEPAVANEIRKNKFNLHNIESLIDFFKKVKAANAAQNTQQ
ncbi:hypothetical protein EOD41_11725 [Mucilaginibacter limnophilus]|uniref:Uncharacterized protein n=1 Tax=Mucilaginibacter limnophilus TaxID=1932778 RepID=A0A3S3TGR7_9SPHI|nr:hypothetical protein [Mucilaginibacter limnophilus]RVU00662.1 hypothetical protein EOD41_11725 [Mucilaginibacter limnophilus]